MRAAGEPEWGDVAARVETSGALYDRLRAVERVVGGPADVELALGVEPLVLQARPRAAAPLALADRVFHVEGDWRLDAEHNPRPLSAAQAGLVELASELGVGARQRVLASWLYVERGAPRGLTPIPLQQLASRFAADVRPDCEARLADVEDRGELEPALDAFAHVYRRYTGEVAPSLARARGELDQFLRVSLREPLAAHGALLAGLGGATVEKDQLLWRIGRAESERGALEAEYAQRFGACAPAWDVAVPTDGETPERVRAAAERLAVLRAPAELHAEAVRAADEAGHALLERLDRMARRAFKALWSLARETLPIAEDDDLLFFRAQRAVRRALLAAGARLGLDDASDVFELPLALVRTKSPPPVEDLRAQVVSGRAARLAAARVEPPIAIDAGRPRHAAPPALDVLRGHATSGRARGRAFVLRSTEVGADAPPALPDGAVLIAPAILPSLAYLLPGARALVTDHGGATSHGATLAREYGVPAVLGCAGATRLPDGADLYVDGAAGRVYRLS
jgi:pyruvate,water dikinase